MQTVSQYLIAEKTRCWFPKINIHKILLLHFCKLCPWNIMPKCEKVFVIMKWILQWKGGRHALGPRQWSLTNMTLATWHCHDDMTKPDNMTGSGCLQFSVCGQGRRGTGGTPPCWRQWRRTRGWRWRPPSSRRSWTGSWIAGYPYNTHTCHTVIRHLLT